MREQKQLNRDTDYDIVLRCQEGDVDAFEGIVIKYQKKMFNIAYRMIGDYNEASEVVQDSFIAAYKGLKGFKGESRFFTWLYAIVINQSKNRLKQLKLRYLHEQVSLDDSVNTNDGQVKKEFASAGLCAQEKLEKADIEKNVQACISALEDEFREVIVLRDIQDLAYEEISAILEIADGTVKSRLHRAREAVKNCLKKTIGAL